jgi:hypothetical protein
VSPELAAVALLAGDAARLAVIDSFTEELAFDVG